MPLSTAVLVFAMSVADPTLFLTVTRDTNGSNETQMEIGVLRADRGNHYWFRRVERVARAM